jgi:hypothetical protein
MIDKDPVIRFCPRCGAKVKGPNDKFLVPQDCPNCKATVLFWDVTLEPTGEIVEALTFQPLIPSKWLKVGVLVTVVVFGLSILLFMIGFVEVPVILGLLMLLIGGYSIAIFFGQQYKTEMLKKQLDIALKRIDSAREQQSSIAIKYSALQSNFSQLFEMAKSTLEDEKNKYAQKNKELLSQFESASEVMKSRLMQVVNRLNAVQSQSVTNIQRIEEKYAEEQNKQEATLARKLEMELNRLNIKERALYEGVRRLSIKYLVDTKKALTDKLTTENFSQSCDRMFKAIDFCRSVGFDVPNVDLSNFVDEFKQKYDVVVRKQMARDEQARIKDRLREEQKVEQDFERERKRIESEEILLHRLLAEAKARATNESAMQIAELERRLFEATEKKRALSMAQQTRSGNVYVISNIGSFGRNVFKIGMTRRLDPLDRVRELGGASVPFPFDVQMMIACTNAPLLETELHKRFSKSRINKVNFRKEFFRLTIAEIEEAVTELHGTVEYVAEPEALQYNESIIMTDADFEFVQDAIGDPIEELDD